MAVFKRPSSASSSNSSRDSTPPTTQSPIKASRQRRRRRIYQPAKNSLYDLIHEHAGTSLFVRPICWTDLHAELLGAKWEEQPPSDSPLPASVPGSPPTKGHMRPSQTIITLSDSLTQILLPDAIHPILCSNAVKTVLLTLWPEPFSKPHYLPEMHIYFGGRVYREAVRAQIMWNFPSNEPKSCYSSFKSVSTLPANSFNVAKISNSPPQSPATSPMMCYISKKQLANLRKNLFRVSPGPGRTWNEPVWNLQQLRAKQLVPADSDHDPHFVGIFLAMAQKYFYTVPQASPRRDSPMVPGKGIPPCPNFHDVAPKILTHDTDTAEFIVYTGHVTAKFLERFHHPCRTPVGEDEEAPGMKIEYTRVPIWPILGLRERLGKALGEEVVGHFDPEEIETWEQDAERSTNSKRKRETLSEVFQDSFDQESDDEPALSGKKRCLHEGSPVGVVM